MPTAECRRRPQDPQQHLARRRIARAACACSPPEVTGSNRRLSLSGQVPKGGEPHVTRGIRRLDSCEGQLHTTGTAGPHVAGKITMHHPPMCKPNSSSTQKLRDTFHAQHQIKSTVSLSKKTANLIAVNQQAKFAIILKGAAYTGGNARTGIQAGPTKVSNFLGASRLRQIIPPS